MIVACNCTCFKLPLWSWVSWNKSFFFFLFTSFLVFLYIKFCLYLSDKFLEAVTDKLFSYLLQGGRTPRRIKGMSVSSHSLPGTERRCIRSWSHPCSLDISTGVEVSGRRKDASCSSCTFEARSDITREDLRFHLVWMSLSTQSQTFIWTQFMHCSRT